MISLECPNKCETPFALKLYFATGGNEYQENPKISATLYNIFDDIPCRNCPIPCLKKLLIFD
jgi:hypothetical protein